MRSRSFSGVICKGMGWVLVVDAGLGRVFIGF